MLFKLCKRWVETSRFLLLECCTLWSKFFTGVLEIENIHFKQRHLTDTTLKMHRRTCRILEAPCKSSHTSLFCVDFCFRNVHNISVPAHKSAPADRTPGSGVHPAHSLVPLLCFERQVIYKVHNAPSCICCINNWYSHIWTKKLIFKRPNACAALLSPMCHNVVDSGLNTKVHGAAERPLEPYNGQLKSVFLVLLLKDVTIIPFYFFCVRECVFSRSAAVCLRSCRRTTWWKGWSCWRVFFLSKVGWNHRTRVVFQWQCHKDGCYQVSFLYTPSESNKYIMSSAVIPPSTWVFHFQSMVGHHCTGTCPLLFIFVSVACSPSDFFLSHSVLPYSVTRFLCCF